MRVLVTGGTGFVGSHLIEELRSRGDEVRALVRPTGDRAFLESLGAEPVPGQLEDFESLRRACKGCEIVYHAAARVEMIGAEEEFRTTTVQGTENMVRAAGESGVKRFVHLSSCGIYHPSLMARGDAIDEFTATPEPPMWFPYGRAKYFAEQTLRQVCPSTMEWVIVRLGYLYGPRNRTMKTYVEPAMRDSTMMIIGDGQNEMAMVYIKDAVRAIAAAGRSTAAAGQALIVGPNERVTQRQYFDAMADGFGIPRVKKHISYRWAFFFGWLGEFLIRSGPRRNVLRRSAIALTGLPQRLDSRYSQRLLGWQPEVSFADGVKASFDWYHKEYNRGGGKSVNEPRHAVESHSSSAQA